MLTFEKVLDVFRDYLAEDKSYEVVNTSQGYTVLSWDERQGVWYDAQLMETPEALRDILLDNYCEYLAYKMTKGYERDDPTEQEMQEIQEKRRALLERCRDNGGGQNDL